MPQSLSHIIIHLVFSTKNREPFITPEIRLDLCSYLGGILKGLDCHPIIVNAHNDHAHLLFILSKTGSISKVVEKAKTSSSKWIKTQGDEFRDFAWQHGYSAFSVSQSVAPTVKKYIQNQEEHHAKRSFPDELRLILSKHGVSFDEHYLWD